jgi:hypothetical protein
MFNFFKKSKESDLPIKRGLEDIAKLNPKNYGVTILFNNQVLFQILQSKHFMQFGFEPKEENSFVEVHFFNKNKTNTIAIHDKFKSEQLGEKYFYFENPKNNHTYIREVGSNFAKIEEKAFEAIENIYQIDSKELLLEVIGR